MTKRKKNYLRVIGITVLGLVALFAIYRLARAGSTFLRTIDPELDTSLMSTTSVPEIDLPAPSFDTNDLVQYSGTVPHIFFHSLIVFPNEALADKHRAGLFKSNMITVDEFKAILSKMYAHHFVLIDSRLLYSIDAQGHIHKQEPMIPRGKKPFVLSLDDLNYYTTMSHDGFARKLVISEGRIKTEVVQPDGSIAYTNDGDVVPLLEDFIRKHPDFSFKSARGIIALTGYDGILGYRTQKPGIEGEAEKAAVRPVVAALKKTGWIFASHSYSHDHSFMTGKISTTSLASDISLWRNQVEPLVGKTDIYIGPFGQIFTPGDSRRTQLLDEGFHALYGVGLDQFVKYYDTYVQMDRIDVDGYRLSHNEKYLDDNLGI